MNEMELNQTKSVLKENHLFANKSLGQNFLVSSEILDSIIENSCILKTDTIFEIGPGIGTLTEELAKKANLVFAIEKDFKLVDFLRQRFNSEKNVKIIHKDILAYDLGQMPEEYKIIANIPYNITSILIRKFLETKNKPKYMVLMIQKEVAERLTAKPGDSERGILTVMIEMFGKAEIIKEVKKENFYPVPEVDSAIIKITLDCENIKSEMIAESKVESFMRFVKIGFSQKRRQIHHPLMAGLKLSKDEIFNILKEASIDQKLRAEDLSLGDWIELYKTINKFSN